MQKGKLQNILKDAVGSPEPDPAKVEDYVFAPTLVTEEKGEKSPPGKEKIIMVDAALFAIREIMEEYPEAVLYGQDVGRRLGGVFREAATLAEQFGDHRVFNTAIQEAYIIGSTVGMSATGVKPIVEVQFGDYIFPGHQPIGDRSCKKLLSHLWKISCANRYSCACWRLWWRRTLS